LPVEDQVPVAAEVAVVIGNTTYIAGNRQAQMKKTTSYYSSPYGLPPRRSRANRYSLVRECCSRVIVALGYGVCPEVLGGLKY
jgi:hypothetical protein